MADLLSQLGLTESEDPNAFPSPRQFLQGYGDDLSGVDLADVGKNYAKSWATAMKQAKVPEWRINQGKDIIEKQIFGRELDPTRFLTNYDQLIAGTYKPGQKTTPENDPNKELGFLRTAQQSLAQGVGDTIRGLTVNLPEAISEGITGSRLIDPATGEARHFSPNELRNNRRFDAGLGYETAAPGSISPPGNTALQRAESIKVAKAAEDWLSVQGRPKEGALGTVASGLGSAVPTLVTAITTRGLGASTPTAAGVGLVQSAAQLSEEGARDYLASLKPGEAINPEAYNRTVQLNAALSSFDLLPVGKVLQRMGVKPDLNSLDRATGGKLGEALLSAGKAGAKGGAEEGLTEVAQTMAQNFIASDLVAYDKERNTFEGTAEAGLGGASAGAILNGLVSLIAKGRTRGGNQPAQPTPEDPTATPDTGNEVDYTAQEAAAGIDDPFGDIADRRQGAAEAAVSAELVAAMERGSLEQQNGLVGLRAALPLYQERVAKGTAAVQELPRLVAERERYRTDGVPATDPTVRSLDRRIAEARRLETRLGDDQQRLAQTTDAVHNSNGVARIQSPWAKLDADLERQYGLPNGYLSLIAHIESRNNPNAVSPTGASGRMQFISSTAAKYGIAGNARFDPIASTRAGAQLARDNANYLERRGIQVTPFTLYMSHQQGAGGFAQLIRAAQTGEVDAKMRQRMDVNGGKGLAPAQFLDKWRGIFAKKTGDNAGFNYTPIVNRDVNNLPEVVDPYADAIEEPLASRTDFLNDERTLDQIDDTTAGEVPERPNFNLDEIKPDAPKYEDDVQSLANGYPTLVKLADEITAAQERKQQALDETATLTAQRDADTPGLDGTAVQRRLRSLSRIIQQADQLIRQHRNTPEYLDRVTGILNAPEAVTALEAQGIAVTVDDAGRLTFKPIEDTTGDTTDEAIGTDATASPAPADTTATGQPQSQPAGGAGPVENAAPTAEAPGASEVAPGLPEDQGPLGAEELPGQPGTDTPSDLTAGVEAAGGRVVPPADQTVTEVPDNAPAGTADVTAPATTEGAVPSAVSTDVQSEIAPAGEVTVVTPEKVDGFPLADGRVVSYSDLRDTAELVADKRLSLTLYTKAGRPSKQQPTQSNIDATLSRGERGDALNKRDTAILTRLAELTTSRLDTPIEPVTGGAGQPAPGTDVGTPKSLRDFLDNMDDDLLVTVSASRVSASPAALASKDYLQAMPVKEAVDALQNMNAVEAYVALDDNNKSVDSVANGLEYPEDSADAPASSTALPVKLVQDALSRNDTLNRQRANLGDTEFTRGYEAHLRSRIVDELDAAEQDMQSYPFPFRGMGRVQWADEFRKARDLVDPQPQPEVNPLESLAGRFREEDSFTKDLLSDVFSFDAYRTREGLISRKSVLARLRSITGQTMDKTEQKQYLAELDQDGRLSSLIDAFVANPETVRFSLGNTNNRIPAPAVENRLNKVLGKNKFTLTMPDVVREQAAKQGVPLNRIKAAAYNGGLYVNPDAVSSLQQLDALIAEELAHTGIRKLFGKDYYPRLDAIFNALGGDAGVLRFASRNGIELKNYLATKDSKDRSAMLVDELVSHLVLPGQSLTVRVQRTLSAWLGSMRNALRKHGLMAAANLTNADLVYLASQAHKIGKQEAALLDVRDKPALADKDNVVPPRFGIASDEEVLAAQDRRARESLAARQSKDARTITERAGVSMRRTYNKVFKRRYESFDHWKADKKRFFNRTFRSDAGNPAAVHHAFTKRANHEAAVAGAVQDDMLLFDKLLRDGYGTNVQDISADQLKLVNRAMSGNVDAAATLRAAHGDAWTTDLDYFRRRVDAASVQLIRTLNATIKHKLSELDAEGQDFMHDIALDIDNGVFDAEAQPLSPAMASIANLYQQVVTIRNNRGKYLHRAYHAFFDPDWKVKKEHDGTLKKAAEWIANDLLTRFPDKYTPAEAKLAGELQANRMLDDAQVDRDPIVFATRQNSYNNILKHRKDIPAPIRELLGEIEDPTYNFGNSITRIYQYILQHQFQMDLRQAGLQTGLFKLGGDLTSGDGKFTREFPAGKNWEMLRGVYMTPETEQAINDLNPLGALNDDWLGALTKASQWVKFNKTILSPTTAMRNFISGTFLLLQMGYLPTNSSEAYKILRQGRNRGKFGGKVRLADDAYKAELQHLQKLGIVGDGAISAELKAVQRDSQANRGAAPGAITRPGAWDSFRNWAAEWYGFGDDFYKIQGFYRERDALIRNGVTEANAELMAAERVRNLMPTYSNVPRGIQQVQRFPGIAPFVAFPWTQVTNLINVHKYAREDFAAGRDAMARKRYLTAVLSYTLPTALAYAFMGMTGVDEDDDDVLDSFGGPWQQGMLRFYTGKDGNRLSYIDATSLMPSETLMKTIRTAGQSEYGAAGTALTLGYKVLEPYLFSPDIFTGSVLNIINNDNGAGYPIYTDGLTIKDLLQGKGDAEDVNSAGMYLMKNSLPGFVTTNASDFWVALAPSILDESADGDTSGIQSGIVPAGSKLTTGGQEKTLAGAIWGVLGIKVQTYNTDQLTARASKETASRLRIASTQFGRAVDTPSALSDEDLQSAVDRLLGDRQKTFTRLAPLVKFHRDAGLSDQEIIDLMYDGAGSLSKENLVLLVRDGVGKRYELPDKLFKRTEAALRASNLDPQAVYQGQRLLADRKLRLQEILYEKQP